MTGLSLFTGVGGLDLAFEWAGGRVIAMCEKDEFCRRVLKKHWPRMHIYKDVCRMNGEEILKRRIRPNGFEAVDAIFGGGNAAEGEVSLSSPSPLYNIDSGNESNCSRIFEPYKIPYNNILM